MPRTFRITMSDEDAEVYSLGIQRVRPIPLNDQDRPTHTNDEWMALDINRDVSAKLLNYKRTKAAAAVVQPADAVMVDHTVGPIDPPPIGP